MPRELLTVLLCVALMLACLLLLSLRSRPKSRALNVLARLLFSALALLVLHRLDASLPALNAVSWSAVAALGPVGYGLIWFVQGL